MSDLTDRALEDRHTLAPGPWVEVYGDRLLSALVAAELERERDRLPHVKFRAMTVIFGHANALVQEILKALDVFESTTQWSPGMMRKMKLTPQRWAAARGLAITTRQAILAFLTASRPHLKTVSAAPIGAKHHKAADSIENVLAHATALAPQTPECLAKLRMFKESAEKIRDGLLLAGHPVLGCPLYVRAGKNIGAVVNLYGKCPDGGDDGRCWLYRGHPGPHQRRK